MYLADVSVIESAMLHGKAFVFIASALDACFHSIAMGAGGNLTLLDSVGAEDVGFSGITAMTGVDVEDRAFAIVASAGTDTLLVMRVSEWGVMNEVERLVDTSDTRFAGVTALEVFETAGRYFVLAGGADDGITLFEITYKGQLDALVTVADSVDMALQNVTDIEAVVVDGTVQVFVSSATDHGLTQFLVGIPSGSSVIYGGAVEDVLTGSDGNDTIYGHGRSDELRGMGGDDRLVDGRGNDFLWGGEGADVFEFIADGRKDNIMDFKIVVDLIDLRDVPMLHHYSEIDVIPTSNVAKLFYAGKQVVITSVGSAPLTFEMFTHEDFIFG